MEDQEVRLRRLQEECSKLRSLQKHQGWEYLMEVADEQIRNRRNEAFGELENLLEVTKQQFRAGAINGIELFKMLPGMVVESMEEEILEIEKEIESGRGPSANADDGDVGSFESDRDLGEFEPPV